MYLKAIALVDQKLLPFSRVIHLLHPITYKAAVIYMT